MTLTDVKLTLVDSLDDVLALREWLGGRRPYDAIALDTETGGFDRVRDPLRLCQVGDGTHGFAFEWSRWGGILASIVRDWRGRYVLHNAPFDLAFLDREGVVIPRHLVDDTMVMARVNEPHMSMALKTQCSRHVDAAAAGLQVEWAKSTGWTWATVPIDYEPYWLYGALDPVLTYQLFEHHWPIVQREAPRAYELELAVQWVTARMESYGVHVDRELARRKLVEFEAYCVEAETWCKTAYGVKPGSNAAVVRVLQDAGFTFTKATAGGAVSLDSEVLEGIDHPLAQTVLLRRQLQKMASTYVRHYAEEADDNDLLHPSINTLGARTSRMSMSDPNLQNLPRLGTSRAGDVVRNLITTRYADGSLIMCDFDQIEMRLLASMANEPAMIEAFREAGRTGGDFFVNLARQIFQDPTIVKKDKRRQITKNAGYACVPLSTEILTQRGWLSHDEVVVGDQTIGFNPVTRRSEWTRITQVVHYDDADVVRLSNSHRSFDTTPNHRWACEEEKAPRHRRTKIVSPRTPRFVETQNHPQGGLRIILAAKSSVGGTLDITDQEAAILGWVFGDGNIYQGRYTGSPSQGRDGWRVAASMYIGQIKPELIPKIDDLLSAVPHTRHVAKSPTCNGYFGVTWNLDPAWCRSLFQRINVWQPDVGARNIGDLVFDPWQFACALSPSQRDAMVETLHMAEGNIGEVGAAHGRMTMSQANDSPVKDLMIALGYLTGRYVKVRYRPVDETGHGWTRKLCASISYQKAFLTGQRSRITPLKRQPVWCVQTDLGTWTMRQDETPVLTGNTIYGAGAVKFAQTAGIEVSAARTFLTTWNTLYPSVPAFQQAIIAEALSSARNGGPCGTRSPLTNRWFIADERKAYALVNYRIQGTAAEVLKTKIVECAAAGLDEFMVAPVHDEIIMDVPPEHIRDVAATIHKIMNDDTMFAVPITASVSAGARWGEKRDLDTGAFASVTSHIDAALAEVEDLVR